MGNEWAKWMKKWWLLPYTGCIQNHFNQSSFFFFLLLIHVFSLKHAPNNKKGNVQWFHQDSNEAFNKTNRHFFFIHSFYELIQMEIQLLFIDKELFFLFTSLHQKKIIFLDFSSIIIIFAEYLNCFVTFFIVHFLLSNEKNTNKNLMQKKQHFFFASLVHVHRIVLHLTV